MQSSRYQFPAISGTTVPELYLVSTIRTETLRQQTLERKRNDMSSGPQPICNRVGFAALLIPGPDWPKQKVIWCVFYNESFDPLAAF